MISVTVLISNLRWQRHKRSENISRKSIVRSEGENELEEEPWFNQRRG